MDVQGQQQTLQAFVLGPGAGRQITISGVAEISTGSDCRPIGRAYYATVRPGRAEVATAIADQWQGRGLGTLLLGQLAEVAAAISEAAHGLPPDNPILAVFMTDSTPIELAGPGGASPATGSPSRLRGRWRRRPASVSGAGDLPSPRRGRTGCDETRQPRSWRARWAWRRWLARAGRRRATGRLLRTATGRDAPGRDARGRRGSRQGFRGQVALEA
jgi:hypothetical protein